MILLFNTDSVIASTSLESFEILHITRGSAIKFEGKEPAARWVDSSYLVNNWADSGELTFDNHYSKPTLRNKHNTTHLISSIELDYAQPPEWVAWIIETANHHISPAVVVYTNNSGVVDCYFSSLDNKFHPDTDAAGENNARGAWGYTVHGNNFFVEIAFPLSNSFDFLIDTQIKSGQVFSLSIQIQYQSGESPVRLPAEQKNLWLKIKNTREEYQKQWTEFQKYIWRRKQYVFTLYSGMPIFLYFLLSLTFVILILFKITALWRHKMSLLEESILEDKKPIEKKSNIPDLIDETKEYFKEGDGRNVVIMVVLSPLAYLIVGEMFSALVEATGIAKMPNIMFWCLMTFLTVFSSGILIYLYFQSNLAFKGDSDLFFEAIPSDLLMDPKKMIVRVIKFLSAFYWTISMMSWYTTLALLTLSLEETSESPINFFISYLSPTDFLSNLVSIIVVVMLGALFLPSPFLANPRIFDAITAQFVWSGYLVAFFVALIATVPFKWKNNWNRTSFSMFVIFFLLAIGTMYSVAF